MLFVDAMRGALLEKLDGLTDEQASSKPTVSELSVFGIVKHCAHVERRWVLAGIGDREIPGIWPPPPEARASEFVAEDGQTIGWLREFYAQVAEDNRKVIDAIDDLGRVLGTGLDARWILLHLIEELARHAGQADIIRESIDGAVASP